MTIEATPRVARQPISRDVILDHSIALLAEKGVTNFRLKELAQRLKVTIPNLYRYFQDREAIIKATYVRAQIRDAELLCAVINATTDSLTADSDFTATIANFWPAMLSSAAEEQRFVRFKALATIHDAHVYEGEAPPLNEVHVATTRLFRQAQVLGLIDASINPEVLSLCIRSMVLGMVLRDFGDNVNVSDEELTAVVGRFYQSVLAK